MIPYMHYKILKMILLLELNQQQYYLEKKLKIIFEKQMNLIKNSKNIKDNDNIIINDIIDGIVHYLLSLKLR